MISITCTQCRVVLTIDDAFAGGVCRCQHCGTIQTVPAQLKPSATATPYVNPSSTTSKALYKNQSAGRGGGNVATTGSSPSGLDDLAQAVVSSGLSGSGLRSSTLTDGASGGTIPKTPAAKLAPSAEPINRQTAAKKQPIMIYIGGAAILIVGLVIIVLLTRGKGSNSTTPNSGSGGSGGGNSGTVDGSSNGGGGTTAAIPHSFCSVPLSGSNVVYVLDRGGSVKNDFDAIKVATFASIASLGPGAKFAIILCQDSPSYVGYPDKGLVAATSDQIEKVKAQLESEQANGASNLNGGLTHALSCNPTSIVLVTGKPSMLTDADEKAIAAAKKAGGKVTIYAFSVNVENPTLSANKGGNLQYKVITSSDLGG